MSDDDEEQSDQSRGIVTEPPLAEPVPPSPIEASPPRPTRRGRSTTALAVAAMLIFSIAVFLSSPFWARSVAPLLPWGAEASANQYDSIATRVTALEQRPVAPVIETAAIKSAQADLAQRLATLSDDVAALRQDRAATKTAAAAMTQRLAALSDDVAALRQDREAAIKSALAPQTQRLDALAAQVTAGDTAHTDALQKIQQQVAHRDNSDEKLANRLEIVENELHARNNVDRSGSVLLLAALMRDAVEEGRPFREEYAAFKGLTASDSELTDAAASLANTARAGVASRAALQQGLADLADRIAAAKPSIIKSGWWAEAVTRLQGLVTIRHSQSGTSTAPPAQAAIETADADLARGDLAAAIAAIGKLTGAEAAAARVWLQAARGRLAAETEASTLQRLAAARLGSPVAGTPPNTKPSPAPAGGPTPTIPKVPS